jgi:uncharacterized RDD family membrane protein YckC
MPFCSKCGASVGDGASFCNACGQPLPPSAPAQAPAVPPAGPIPSVPPGSPDRPDQPFGCAVLEPRTTGPIAARVAYAGFWLRFVAWFIDAIILGVASTIVLLPFGVMTGFNLHRLMSGHPPSPEDFFSMGGMHIRIFIVRQILHWIYYALLESSVWQGTIGKKALGLEVTDLSGARIDFGRATVRFLGRYVSIFTLGIGFIMAGFTQKKQALHDMIAGTLVLRKV